MSLIGKKRSYSQIVETDNVSDYLMAVSSYHEEQLSLISESLKADYPILNNFHDQDSVSFIRYTNPNRADMIESGGNHAVISGRALQAENNKVNKSGWIWINETSSIVPTTISLSNSSFIEEKLNNCNITQVFRFIDDVQNQLSLPTPLLTTYISRSPPSLDFKYFTETSFYNTNQIKFKNTSQEGRKIDTVSTKLFDTNLGGEYFKIEYATTLMIGAKLNSTNKLEYFRNLSINPGNFTLTTTKSEGTAGVTGISRRGENDRTAKSLNYIVVKNIKMRLYKNAEVDELTNQYYYTGQITNSKWLDNVFTLPYLHIPFTVVGSDYTPTSGMQYPHSWDPDLLISQDFLLERPYRNINYYPPNPGDYYTLLPDKMKFMRPVAKVLQNSAANVPQAKKRFGWQDDTHTLGIKMRFRPPIFDENLRLENTKPMIIMVQNLSSTIENFLISPVEIGGSLRLTKDLIKCFITTNHIPYGSNGLVIPGGTLAVGSHTACPYVDIISFDFDNTFLHDVRDVFIRQDTTSNEAIVDYNPVETNGGFFYPEMKMQGQLNLTASYQFFRPDSGFVSQTQTLLTKANVLDRLNELETNVNTSFTELASFSMKLYDAVTANYTQLFNIVGNMNNQIDRDKISTTENVLKNGKGVFIKLFNLIPVIGQYSNTVDQIMDTMITFGAQMGRNMIVDSVLSMKDSAAAMSMIDTHLVASVLSRNYNVKFSDKEKLGKNTLTYLQDLMNRLNMLNDMDDIDPYLIVNKCTYYLRKISQFKQLGTIGWKYTKHRYTNDDLMNDNLVPAHAFLEIELTDVTRTGTQRPYTYTLIKHVVIVSTGDFYSLQFNVLLLTLLRESQRKSLFNYIHLRQVYDFTAKKWEWLGSNDAEHYTAFFEGLSLKEIKNPKEDQHYAVLTTECNMRWTSLQFFLDAFRVNAPQYYMLGYNCQVQSKEVMNFIVQGVLPSWWSGQNKIDLAISIAEAKPDVYDASFIDSLRNPNTEPEGVPVSDVPL
jgi:hypothetical protein